MLIIACWYWYAGIGCWASGDVNHYLNCVLSLLSKSPIGFWISHHYSDLFIDDIHSKSTLLRQYYFSSVIKTKLWLIKLLFLFVKYYKMSIIILNLYKTMYLSRMTITFLKNRQNWCEITCDLTPVYWRINLFRI